MSKIRITVDIEINDEAKEELNITEEAILNGIRIDRDDAVDGVLIFQNVEGLDPTNDIIFGNGKIISREIINCSKEGVRAPPFCMLEYILSFIYVFIAYHI